MKDSIESEAARPGNLLSEAWWRDPDDPAIVRCEPTKDNPQGIVYAPDFPIHLRSALIALAKGEVTFAQLFPNTPRNKHKSKAQGPSND